MSLLAFHAHNASVVTYLQHLLFEAIADGGGYYASKMCSHWYHKVPLAIAFALLSTLLLVTFVG